MRLRVLARGTKARTISRRGMERLQVFLHHPLAGYVRVSSRTYVSVFFVGGSVLQLTLREFSVSWVVISGSVVSVAARRFYGFVMSLGVFRRSVTWLRSDFRFSFQFPLGHISLHVTVL